MPGKTVAVQGLRADVFFTHLPAGRRRHSQQDKAYFWRKMCSSACHKAVNGGGEREPGTTGGSKFGEMNLGRSRKRNKVPRHVAALPPGVFPRTKANQGVAALESAAPPAQPPPAGAQPID